tara:strand:+ start:786 stop:1322 length:537 start_codon:yes stop_codon:yes gene_type:complete
MIRKNLHPNQIITLRDYPLYNQQILKIYFLVFHKRQGKILPPCPVIHKSVAIPYSKGKNTKSKTYNTFLKKYLEKNPKAEYFLLDGGHKSSAATLAHKKIPVFVISNNQDLKKAKKLKTSGKLLGWHTIEKSIKDVMKDLTKHHFGTKEFLTVEDKVRRMVKNKDISKHLIHFYKNKK